MMQIRLLWAQGLLAENFKMSSFFWNVHGFNKQLKHFVVKEWLYNQELQFGCILETRVKEKKARQNIGVSF